MTHSDVALFLPPLRDFMRKTHDRAFREHLEQLGWVSGQDVVIAFDDESVTSLISRLAYNEATNPCLVAIPHQDEPHGFRLMFMEAVASKRTVPWRRRPHGERISPRATVGMLYLSLTECDAYLPSDWYGSSMTFSKAREHA